MSKTAGAPETSKESNVAGASGSGQASVGLEWFYCNISVRVIVGTADEYNFRPLFVQTLFINWLWFSVAQTLFQWVWNDFALALPAKKNLFFTDLVWL